MDADEVDVYWVENETASEFVCVKWEFLVVGIHESI